MELLPDEALNISVPLTSSGRTDHHPVTHETKRALTNTLVKIDFFGQTCLQSSCTDSWSKAFCSLLFKRDRVGVKRCTTDLQNTKGPTERRFVGVWVCVGHVGGSIY